MTVDAPAADAPVAAVGSADASAEPRVRVLGVRHHGPGSARAVRAALEEWCPTVVLVEGPADADPLTVFVGREGMEPPVALLAATTDAPRRAAWWPFATFSPEWQALRWAAEHGVPARFIDLPAGVVLAREPGAGAPDGQAPDGDASGGESGDPGAGVGVDQDDAADADEAGGVGGPDASDVRADPVAALAHAAGYDDPERWWEDVVEQRSGDAAPFDVVADAMAALREAFGQEGAGAGTRGVAGDAPADDHERHEARREAYMRQQVRAALREGHERVAVVCGAWHAPALRGRLPAAAPDARLLTGLPKRKVLLTWAPWTASRLSLRSGYGAGIESPGWYEHLFTCDDDVVARWLVRVAGVLRERDLPVSSAHVIEATRLATVLAAVRGRPLAGLAEVTEATRAVLCEGDDALLAHVTADLVVGERLGTVPDDVPTVPLEADLRATARRLRLPFEAAPRTLELDLRKANDLARSQLLHRLALLGVAWGTPDVARTRSTGTFRETWSLHWRPELTVALVEASTWGVTVPAAAAACVVAGAAGADLPAITRLVEHTLVADLPDALDALLPALDERAARDVDVTHVLHAVPPLVRAHRYTDVRGTRVEALARVADALVVRACAALPGAVTGLDDDAARALRTDLDAAHDAVRLRDDADVGALWTAALRGVAGRTDVSGVLSGRATRLLLDAQELTPEAAATRLSRALSRGTPARTTAAWAEGFLDGGGLLIAGDRRLLTVLDDWVATLREDDFTDVLPLLRRTFGGLPVGERRALADAVAHLGAGRARAVEDDLDLDPELVSAPLATVLRLLGAPS
ncbi:conserved hypothetical protein [Cellulomonas flavigena DSM 20109]|uniref:Uncharacterized protein n=1 Tax=Cellulomonas flavigena (strain ATCC 482 / DSM 20109 / BCRC 11376 / JCM 18109 / NBRC 3775 / NCIMB 8073 / NRS 134) TaxID=446466 RepID=D5UBT3_CELFN|nr:DUF5682 family protein [Cellulomonas flavigena]ADG74178.1 conserved hypothetical protein [Cellulomonas flavigena DSM 20109]